MMRSSYHNRVKLWQDKQNLTPGRWIRLADDAPFLPFEHPWGSRKTWDRDFVRGPDDCGEVDYSEWNNGARPEGWVPSLHICGREGAVREGGLSLVDDPIPLDAGGVNECCFVPLVCGRPLPKTLLWSFGSPAGCTCCDGQVFELKRWEAGDSDDLLAWRSVPFGDYNLPFGTCSGGTSITAHVKLFLEQSTCIWRAELWQRKTPPFGGDSVVFCFPHVDTGEDLLLTADSLDSTVSWNQVFGVIQDSSDCQVRVNNAAKRWTWAIAATE